MWLRWVQNAAGFAKKVQILCQARISFMSTIDYFMTMDILNAGMPEAWHQKKIPI